MTNQVLQDRFEAWKHTHWMIEMTDINEVTYRYSAVGHPQQVMRYMKDIVQSWVAALPNNEEVTTELHWNLVDEDYNPNAMYLAYEHDVCILAGIAYVQIGIDFSKDYVYHLGR